MINWPRANYGAEKFLNIKNIYFLILNYMMYIDFFKPELFLSI